MTTHHTDAQLVAGHLAGDPGALAGIYDRYADSLHDTAAAMLRNRHDAADVLQDVVLIAAERLGQLRDPDRLKPWLFAILRNEVYRRTKQRSRTVSTDFSGSDEGYDMADDRHLDPGDDVTEQVAGDDLATLVRDAAGGLDERDQLVLELSVRQGLEGQDLADALGVSANQSYTLVHRMRERVERSLGAFVVATAGRGACDTLDGILGAWDGEFTVLIRKRVARHIDRCDVCADSRRRVAPLALFAGAPVLAAPPSLREQILEAASTGTAPSTPYGFEAEGGFPGLVRGARRVAGWIAPTAAASLILVAATLAFLWIDRNGDPDTVRGAVAERPEPTEPPVTTVAPARPADTAATDDTTAPTTATDATTATTTSTTIAVTTTTTAPTTTVAPTTTAAVLAPTGAPPTTTAPAAPTGSPTPAPPPPAPTVAPPPPPAPTPTPTTTPVTAAPTTTTTTTTTTTLPPGALSISGGLIDLGSSANSGSVTVSNTGGLPVDFVVAGSSGNFGIGPTSGTLAGGQSQAITATIDRSGLPEGQPQSATVQVSGSGASFSLTLRATVERPPQIRASAPRIACRSADVAFTMGATITDESGVAGATFTMSGPGGTASTSMSQPNASGWNGFLSFAYPGGPNAPGSADGAWSWSVTATDTRGNSATSSGAVTVDC